MDLRNINKKKMYCKKNQQKLINLSHFCFFFNRSQVKKIFYKQKALLFYLRQSNTKPLRRINVKSGKSATFIERCALLKVIFIVSKCIQMTLLVDHTCPHDLSNISATEYGLRWLVSQICWYRF